MRVTVLLCEPSTSAALDLTTHEWRVVLAALLFVVAWGGAARMVVGMATRRGGRRKTTKPRTF